MDTIGISILLFFLSITWFKKIWILWRPINEDDPNVIDLPKNLILRYLFNTSKTVMSNAVARTCIYFLSICVLTLSALIHLVSCVYWVCMRKCVSFRDIHTIITLKNFMRYNNNSNNNICKWEGMNELYVLVYRLNVIWTMTMLMITIHTV